MARTRRNFLGASLDPAQALFTALSQSFFNLAVANKTACARAAWWRIDWLK